VTHAQESGTSDNDNKQRIGQLSFDSSGVSKLSTSLSGWGLGLWQSTCTCVRWQVVWFHMENSIWRLISSDNHKKII